MTFQPIMLAALLLAQVQPAPGTCVTREEAGDLAVAVIPHIVGGISERCRPHLQPGAFLVTRGPALRERLERDAVPRREAALRTVGKISGGAIPPGVRPETAFEMIAQVAAAGLLENLDEGQCGDIDNLIAALEPLPTANLAQLTGAVLSLARVGEDDGEEGSGRGGPPICRP